MASLALFVWLADHGQHDHVTARLDDLLTGALHGILEEDWTAACLPLPTRTGSPQAVKARGEAHRRVIDVITEHRPCDEVLTSPGMADGTG